MEISDFCKSMLEQKNIVLKGSVEKINGEVFALHLEVAQQHASDNLSVVLHEIIDPKDNAVLDVECITRQLGNTKKRIQFSSQSLKFLSDFFRKAVVTNNDFQNYFDHELIQQATLSCVNNISQTSLRTRVEDEYELFHAKQVEILNRAKKQASQVRQTCDQLQCADAEITQNKQWCDINAWNERIEKRKQAAHKVSSGQEIFDSWHFETSQKFQDFVKEHSFDEFLYKRCTGNQLQKVFSRQDIRPLTGRSLPSPGFRAFERGT